MAKSYEDFDKPYRRGLVLGLSLAEVFLILLFLLLLVFMGLTTSLQEELQESQDTLEVTQEVIGKQIKIEDFTRLVEIISKLKSEVKELSDQLADMQEKLAESLSEKTSLEEKIDKLEAEISELDKELVKEQIKKELAESQLEDVNRESAKKDQVIDEYAKKGQDPPCWFVNVPDEDEVDGIRQKHVKIFDVKIEDNSFSVRWHDNSKIKFEIDKGNEIKLPQVGPNILGKKLSVKRFTQEFSRFDEAGATKLIQNYKCRFMVDIFDETSVSNKLGYKRNLRVVENLFYKFEERKPW